MIKATFEDLKLVMFKNVDMPKRVKNVETNKWEPTGEKESRTEYTFRDEFGDVIVVFGNNDYRELEGRQCDVVIGIAYNEFDRKNKISLQSCTPAD